MALVITITNGLRAGLQTISETSCTINIEHSSSVKCFVRSTNLEFEFEVNILKAHILVSNRHQSHSTMRRTDHANIVLCLTLVCGYFPHVNWTLL
jgi:hypothetical protein